MAVVRLGENVIKSSESKIYMIAEIGQNHQGSIDTAKQMILEAKKAGCDCVKFQKSCLSAKFTKSALNRIYDGQNSWGSTYGEHKEYLEFTLNEYLELQHFCKEINIDFTASAMDEVSLNILEELDVPFIKIGSGDANNFPMLEKSAKLMRPLVISTGMQSMATVVKIIEIMKRANKTNYCLLHCVSAYPTEPADCNLQMIPILMKKYPDIVIGYSGHEIGIEITKAAVLLGARVIERHFTLDKTQKGSDHKCSLEPKQLQQLLLEINMMKQKGWLDILSLQEPHSVVDLLGNGKCLQKALKEVKDKEIMPCEWNCKQKLGKSIVAARNLKRGHRIRREDISIKVSEPNGIFAEDYEAVLGAELSCDVADDEPIMHTHISHN